MDFSEIRLNTDKSLFLFDYEEERSYSFQSTRESVDLRKNHFVVPSCFSQMSIVLNGNTKIYTRTYLKLFALIANIGGLFNGIVYSAYILLYFYSKNIILWYCITGILSPDEIKDNIDDNFISRFDSKSDTYNCINFKSIKVENKSNLGTQNENGRNIESCRCPNNSPNNCRCNYQCQCHNNQNIYPLNNNYMLSNRAENPLNNNLQNLQNEENRINSNPRK